MTAGPHWPEYMYRGRMKRAFEGWDTVWRLLIDAFMSAGEHAGPVAVGADLFALLINKSVPFVVRYVTSA